MTMWLLKGYVMLVLLLIFIEDLRHRAVHWSLFAQLALCLGLLGALTLRKRILFDDTVFNLSFIAVQFGVVSLWYSLRARRWVNLLRDRVGPGDLLFLAISTLAFSRFNFILFVLSGLVFSLLAYGLILLLVRRAERTVPTAGALAIYMAVWMGLELTGVVAPLHSSIPLIPV